ncbi:MAG TPA: energy transducer TonB [Pyrinomonadaceae bacterium]|nr:energy transducer TonB [Pyrinomonadaceae bacterium]
MLSNSGLVRWKSHSVMLLLGLVLFMPNAVGRQLTSQTSSRRERTPEWERYTVRERDFSVLLPSAPGMSVYDERKESLTGLRRRHLIGVYSNGVVYAIYVFERRHALNAFIDEFKNEYGQSGEFQRKLKVSSSEGVEYRFQNDAMSGVTQYFITKRNLYVFKAHSSSLVDSAAEVTRFFESIELEPTEGGIAIVEGAGLQSSRPPASAQGEDIAYSAKDVTRKAVVVVKPEPAYTEDARKQQITGTVIVRCVFAASGAVTKLVIVSGLSSGLTEKALQAARQIRFIPAIKDGRFVSTHLQLEYTFDLY